MKRVLLSMGLAALMASTVMANAGDWWILPIDTTQGSFTTHSGAGYSGADALEGNGADGVRRVWWNTTNVAASSGGTLPATLESFTVEAYGATAGGQDWQPIEVQINGYGGPINYPIDAEIPWAGQFGTNHEWIGSNGAANGAFNATGPGPQTHDGGSEVYIKDGSVLFAKWDFGWNINRSWSAIRITQVTPEPTSALLVLVGAPLLLRRKRRA